MKKFFVTLFVFFLIFTTAIVKNSTKRIDDEIFVLKENISDLKKNFENTRLEFDYLSSTEKLLEYQSLYFEKDLIQKNIDSIKILKKRLNDLLISNLNF